MIRGLSIVVMAVALAACEQQARDGYRFARKEFDRPRIALTVVEYSSLSDLRRSAKAAGVEVGDRELMAFGKVAKNGIGCTVHIVDPSVSYQPEWIGHEIAHCVHGRWHP